MKSATSFSRSGMSDWIIQRVSAVILAVYFVVIVGWFAVHNGGVTYTDWHDFMNTTCMRIFNLLALLSLAGHAWVGLWTVFTDYVTVRQMGEKATFLRFLLQIGMGLSIFVYVVWGLMIFWGN